MNKFTLNLYRKNKFFYSKLASLVLVNAYERTLMKRGTEKGVTVWNWFRRPGISNGSKLLWTR